METNKQIDDAEPQQEPVQAQQEAGLITERTKSDEPESKETGEMGKQFVKHLRTFLDEVDTRIEKLKDEESIELISEGEGLHFSATSKKFDVCELSNLGLQSFDLMREKRQGRNIIGVG